MSTWLRRRAKSSLPALTKYQELVTQGYLQHDERQIQLLEQLHNVCLVAANKRRRNWMPSQLTYTLRRWTPTTLTPMLPHQGVYVYGGVGIGKTMCMDIAVQSTESIPKENIRRSHFHAFMLDVHGRLHRLRQENPLLSNNNSDTQRSGRTLAEVAERKRKSTWNPLRLVAQEIRQESWLLAFDEFQVTDVADAMILKQLFSELWKHGVTIICTSNRKPDDLYEHGLNRELFLPFISSMKEQMQILNVDEIETSAGQHEAVDYRLKTSPADGVLLMPVDCKGTEIQTYLQEVFSACSGGLKPSEHRIQVAFGRKFIVQAQAKQQLTNGRRYGVAWFSFENLCQRSVGAADYLSLVDNYQTIIVEDIPQMGIEQHNEARRFITFIDTAYESCTRLILTSHTPSRELFRGLHVHAKSQCTQGKSDNQLKEVLTSSGGVKLVETDSQVDEASQYADSSRVQISRSDDEDETEALISMGELSGIKDTGFAYHRALSRLREMQSERYLMQHSLRYDSPDLPSRASKKPI